MSSGFLCLSAGLVRALRTARRPFSNESPFTRFDVSQQTLVRLDWLRVPLPRDVEPADAVDVSCRLVFDRPGTWSVRVDLVARGIAWFDGSTGRPIGVIVSLP